MKRAFARMLASVAHRGVFNATPAVAEYRCDNPGGVADRRAHAAAERGREALRRFIERTRAVYGLHYWDCIEPHAAAGA